ncbi:MAG TPA: sensor histidine kinase N-terminal domain-containing protein [Burkholderiales bacterium]|nr:sensor histidine kinase N-terminal domain-containing protein [Burkholderiales bacterium]
MARSLRGNLLRLLLPPMAALLVASAVGTYFLSFGPASEAYDQALVDVALALRERIRSAGGAVSFDLPGAAERLLRTDKYDTVYYSVRGPDGKALAGDPGLPPVPRSQRAEEGVIAYDGTYGDKAIRVAALLAPCGGRICMIQVAETTHKRQRLARDIVVLSLVPALLVALLIFAALWFGVGRGVAPLERLSDEIRARSPGDLRPIEPGLAPREAEPLVRALNQLLDQVAESRRNQQRFLANAAHQLRTPLAGLQAHAEIALTRPEAEALRTELEQVHRASIRAARLAGQLLALSRAEPGGYRAEVEASLDLRSVVEGAADEWVHRALEKEIDLGFELHEAPARGDALLLREALGNLVHNAIQYAPRGGRVTVRTGLRNARPFLEVEDDGPGIPPTERERVLERFYRVPGTPGTGSGLGLSIVREIAAAHGAAVEIGEGEGGRGCKVGLTFPHG